MSASIENFGPTGFTALLIIFSSVIVSVNTDEHSIGSKMEAERIQKKKYGNYAFSIIDLRIQQRRILLSS